MYITFLFYSNSSNYECYPQKGKERVSVPTMISTVKPQQTWSELFEPSYSLLKLRC